MPIQRFDNWGKMERDGEGAFVSYSDHVAALATTRREALEEGERRGLERAAMVADENRHSAWIIPGLIRALPLDHIPDDLSTGDL